MAVTLPLEGGVPFYSFSTQLGGVTFLFDVRWNSRHGVWYFDILDEDEDVISANNAILLGSRPVYKSADSRRPKGYFVVRDSSGEAVDATFDDLGVRVFLDFYTLEEAQEISA